ncbi:MAG: class I SAM-dependent methyltransferase [Planctomycetes bacterium]|nr:class I SAM-dependent methyltransferase [Planctomycetota bacterium]
MAHGDRERWNAKYEAAWNRAPEPPDEFVLRSLLRLAQPTEAQGASALDLAAGSGRHALDLARRGWLVEAWDVSPVALELLRKRASSKGLLVATRELDLATGAPLDFRRKPFDLVVAVDFLERTLFADFAKLVAPDGHLIFSTFTVDRTGEKPPLRYCLERGELSVALPDFETLATVEQSGRAGLFARRRTNA